MIDSLTINNIVDTYANSPYWENLLKSEDPIDDFLYIFSPILNYIHETLSSNLESRQLSPIMTHETINQWIKSSAGEKIKFLSQNILVIELHEYCKTRQSEQLDEKSLYQSFIQLFKKTDNLLTLFKKYPELERRVILTINQSIDFFNEFIEQFKSDLKEIESTIVTHKIINITSLKLTGDQHHNGKCVIMLQVQTDVRLQDLIYKPACLSIDIAFNNLLAFFNTEFLTHFKLLKIIDKQQYGWREFISHQSADTSADVHSFYRELGELLAILTFINGYDFHRENIIAHGHHPVLLDLECLMMPYIKELELEEFNLTPLVLRTMLLPGKIVLKNNARLVDLSGLSNDQNAMSLSTKITWKNPRTAKMMPEKTHFPIPHKEHMPFINEKIYDYTNYEADIITGFDSLYNKIEIKKELLGQQIKHLFQNTSSRVIFRNTFFYHRLLTQSNHPKLLLSKKALINYFQDSLSKNNTELQSLIPFEIQSLLIEDIPYFKTSSNTLELHDTNNQQIPFKSHYSGVERIAKQTSALPHHQYQVPLIINAFVAASVNDKQKRNHFSRIELTQNIPNTATVDALINKICQHLISSVVITAQSCRWPTIARSTHVWHASLCDFDLYGGAFGTILALHFAHQFFNHQQSGDIVKRFVEQIQVNDNNTIVNSLIDINSIGFHSGYAGVLYALLLLIQNGYPNLQPVLNKLFDVFEMKILSSTKLELSILNGCAGALLVLNHLTPYIEKQRIQNLQTHLIEQVFNSLPHKILAQKYSVNSAPFTLGFAHGISGIIYALSRTYIKGNENQKIKSWLSDAANYLNQFFDSEKGQWPKIFENQVSYELGWCHGSSGFILALIELNTIFNRDDYIAQIQFAEKNLQDSFPEKNDCLCHGNIGTIDTALILQQNNLISDKQNLHYISKFTQHIQTTSLSTNQEMPIACINGLLMGSSGLLYQLLRIRHLNQIPSVLAI